MVLRRKHCIQNRPPVQQNLRRLSVPSHLRFISQFVAHRLPYNERLGRRFWYSIHHCYGIPMYANRFILGHEYHWLQVLQE